MTIQSVEQQTYENWELIIVDDCSTDNSCEIISMHVKQDARIKLVKSQSNFGAPAGPRNIGVEIAQGEWIAFLDSDDLWHPEKLAKQVSVIHETRARFCSTSLKNFSDESEVINEMPGSIGTEKITFMRQLRRFRTPTSSVIVAKEIMQKYPFNEDIRYKAREDMECWLRIHEHLGSSIKLSYPLVWYRISENQISASKISMAKRTFLILSEYRFSDGSSLGIRKYLYLFTHLLYSIYYRLINKKL